LSGIRVTYSGLVSLVFGFVTVFLGLIYILIVTRTLDPIEYGTWNLIQGLVIYPLVLEPIITYWSTRETARGIESGRTAIISGGIFSVIGVMIYLIAAYFIGQQSGANVDVLLLGVILIPAIFLNRMLAAINFGWKPHAPVVAQFVFVVFEIIFALILVYFFKMQVFGVIVTVAIGYVASIIILFIYAKEKIKNKINFKFLKKWLKLFWVPLYPSIGNTVLLLDITIFSIIAGSVIGLAFWGAAFVISTTIQTSGLISRAVYPKLLQDDNYSYLGIHLNHLFYVLILMTAITITFSKEALFILNPQYVIAFPVVIILSLQMFFGVIRGQTYTFLRGIEKVDVNKKATFKDYLKSKLFFVPTLELTQSIIYIGSLIVGLFLLINMKIDNLNLLIFWAIILLLTQIPFSLYGLSLLRKHLFVSIDIRTISKYFLTAIVIFGLLHFITEKLLVYDENVFVFVPTVFLFVALGVGSYIGITYIIDPNIKDLFNLIIREIKNKNN